MGTVPVVEIGVVVAVPQIEEERLALALSSARLGTWTWDMAAGTTAWDTRLEELHGLAPGGFGGTFEDWLESLHPGDRAECLACVERALADPGPYSLLHRTIWPDGSQRWVECRGKVLTDTAGVPTGTVGVAFDVTEREERQAALARQRAEEHRLVQTVQRALQKLSELVGSCAVAPDDPDAVCTLLMRELLSAELNDDDASVVAFPIS